MNNNTWIAIIVPLLGVIGFFLKRILDTMQKIEADVTDMRPKVQIMWEIISKDFSRSVTERFTKS